MNCRVGLPAHILKHMAEIIPENDILGMYGTSTNLTFIYIPSI